MTRYWVIRTDKKFTEFIWSEIKAARLRQGWGWRDDQDLRLLVRLREQGTPFNEPQQKTWRGNRRLLSTEPDSVQFGDVVITPHLPNHGVWSIVRVVGDYFYDGPGDPESNRGEDYSHVLPVELLTTEERPISPFEEGVAAGLRQTMGVRSRMWNIDGLAPEVEALLELVRSGAAPVAASLNRLPHVLTSAEAAAWDEIVRQFHGAEFERPCIMLLEVIYGEGNVEHTGGRSERGADAICTYSDPLGIVHRAAVQIKMWSWDADWIRPLDQIRQAHGAYEGITAGVILSTSEQVTDRFEAARAALEAELRILVRVLLREELVRLFLTNLPRLAGLQLV
jgi:hypothetical protein